MIELINYNDNNENNDAIDFCSRFLKAEESVRYIFGTNTIAKSIAEQIPPVAFIDDFTQEKCFCGKPIIRTQDVPEGIMAVSSVVGVLPWSAKYRMDEFGIENLDYYSFYKYSGISLANPFFWDDFETEFENHQKVYTELYKSFGDEISRKQFRDIINFRLSWDINWMKGYKNIQHQQYFEDFLKLKQKEETFVDVGGFDGFTTTQFINRCPEYSSVYFFEPESKNLELAKKNLNEHKRINYFCLGLSDRKGVLRFDPSGSCSRISSSGEVEIKISPLDELVEKSVTFIKMDIEGAELDAIEGARKTIERNHPRLAIASYHYKDDFRKIPEKVLSIRSDYSIYIRHYTEGTQETVLYFIPKERNS